MRKVTSAVKELSAMIDEWLSGKTQKLEEYSRKISSLEEEADSIKRALIDEVSKATAMLQREDMLRLTLLVDEIADYVDATAFRLLTLRDWDPHDDVKTQIKELSDKIVEIVETLRKAIFALPFDVEKAIKVAEQVDIIEKSIDTIHRNLGNLAYTLNIDSKTLLRFLDFLRHLEEIADISEHVADAIRIIAIARRG